MSSVQALHDMTVSIYAIKKKLFVIFISILIDSFILGHLGLQFDTFIFEKML